MNITEVGIAHAEEECRIKVETYSPRYPGRPITGLEANVPCDSTQIISALVPLETGINNMSISERKPITPFEFGMAFGAAAVLAVGSIAFMRSQGARDLASRLRR